MKFYSETTMERAIEETREDTRSNFASDGEADQLVAGSRDHRDQRPADAAVVAQRRKRDKNSKRRPQRSRTGLIEFCLPRSPIGPPPPLLDQKISGKW